MRDRLRRSIDATDRRLGRVLWLGVALALLGVAAFVGYAGVAGFQQEAGGARWAILLLALTLSGLCVAGARGASRRQRLSGWMDDS